MMKVSHFTQRFRCARFETCVCGKCTNMFYKCFSELSGSKSLDIDTVSICLVNLQVFWPGSRASGWLDSSFRTVAFLRFLTTNKNVNFPHKFFMNASPSDSACNTVLPYSQMFLLVASSLTVLLNHYCFLTLMSIDSTTLIILSSIQ